MMRWFLILLALSAMPSPVSVPGEVVTVHAAGPTRPFDHYWEAVVGAGHAGLHRRRDFQEHLRMAVRELGFRSIRCHGIFGDALEVCRRDAQGRLHVNWQQIDEIYDAYRRLGIRPFVELSFMPSALASGSTTVFTYRGNVTPPRDWDEWAWFVEAFARHLIARYGADEVRRWWFEVWNEPDMKIFWAGTELEYFRLYEVTARALRSVDAGLRVGGPAAASPRCVTRWLAYTARARQTPLPVDFISFHTYGGNIRGPQAAYAPIGVLSELARQVTDVRDRSPFATAPLHVTEWNSTPESRDPAHDTELNAAFVCEAVAEMRGRVQSFAYWTVSDIFEERGYPSEPFHGGFGLVSIDGLRKPSFHAFALLHRLATEELELETTAPASERPNPGLATRGADGLIGILLWNWPYVRPREAAGTRRLRLVVEGLESGSYEVGQTWIDATDGNVLAAWRRLGEPHDPDPDQLAALQRASRPGASAAVEHEVADGRWSASVDLEPGAVRLLTLRRRGPR